MKGGATTLAKKKKNEDGLYFVGENAQDVTGSMIYGVFSGKKFLIECGLHQSSSNSYLDSYKVNSKKFDFDPKEIEYVFVGHTHIDHIGRIPKLFKEGCKAKIICTPETFVIMKDLLLNCVFILKSEAEILSNRYKRNYEPLYSEDDVYEALKHVCVYDEYNKIYKLDDIISFQWLHNSHCVGAAQIQIILNNGLKNKKILYSSDIGALHTKNHYVVDTVIPDMHNDVTIMESTYGLNSRTSKKTREFEIEHLRVAIDTVLERRGCLLFPSFSFARTQEILTIIYDLFHNDENFNVPILIDSKLSCEISEDYRNILRDENLELWENVFNWKNVKFVKEKEESQMWLADNAPKLIISSSGFCTNGRILNNLEKYLKDVNSMIVFSGYVGDNPSYLSYRIKNYKDHKTININKKPVPNKADTISLLTMSSHANHDDLVKYGSSLKTDKLILVHGSEESKRCLKEDLQKAISKNDSTYKVVCSTKDMVVHL